MDINRICILISSLSFFAYAISYFTAPNMKLAFKRLGVEKFGLFTIVLEILGASGLILGLYFKPLLIISSLGLALLMFFALVFRMRTRDSLWISLPAAFYMCLNAWIFWQAMQSAWL